MFNSRERRQFGRRIGSIQGWIRVRGRPRIACVARNISPGGAFLECEVPAWLPFQFELLLGDDATTHVCEIRHVLSKGVGVLFQQASETMRKSHPVDRDRPASEVDAWIGTHAPVIPRNRSER